MVRTSRGPRQGKICQRSSRKRKLDITPELRAPTSEIEGDLTNVIARFGERKVVEALDLLATKRNWNDWQCVANAIPPIARQK